MGARRLVSGRHMAARARRPLIAAVCVVFALAWALAGALEQAREPPLPATLRVGIDPSFPPFAWTANEALSGIDPALAQAIGEALALPVQFVLLGFDGVYDALAADQVDMVLAALPIDPARRDRVHYTPPYFNMGLMLVSQAETPLNVMGDLPGRRLAFEYGSTGQTEAGRWLRRIAPFELRPYERAAVALDAVRLGEADAALVDAVSAHVYEQAHPDWRSAAMPITVVPLAAALRADRPRLARLVDEVIARLSSSGALDRMSDSAFAVSP